MHLKLTFNPAAALQPTLDWWTGDQGLTAEGKREAVQCSGGQRSCCVTGTELAISVAWPGRAAVDTLLGLHSGWPWVEVERAGALKASPQAQSLLPELPSWARDVSSVPPSPCRNSGENGGPT